MRYRITRPHGLLGLVTALLGVAPCAYAQLVCTGSNPGLGDQVWGTTFGPSELANACGVTAVGYFSLVNDTGNLNTAVGLNGLFANTSGASNSAFGANALYANTTGASNTAVGASALQNNYTASFNTGIGTSALQGSSTPSNNTGAYNTAVGYQSMFSNTTGGYNAAVGWDALIANTTGTGNTGIGADALNLNTSGASNTGIGDDALGKNITGNYNTAVGVAALFGNTASNNNAVGYLAMYSSTSGANNVADGYEALYKTTTGSNNVALGYEAGYNQTTGSNNIYIDHLGVAAESGVIRIGVAGTQTTTYVAGITGVAITGAAVYVTTSGQLGVLSSSERYKTAIAPMGASTEKLTELRPVSFHLKTDPKGAVQYGLIAEEVDKVYPELVIRDETGKIQGVHYEELAPMLLNELQDQQRKVTAVANRNAEQAATITAQAEEIRELKRQQEEMQTVLRALQMSIPTSRSASAREIANQTVAQVRPAAFLETSGR